MNKIGRNDPCPCGSGKKYKKCCQSSRSLIAIQEQATRLMDQHRFAEAEQVLSEVMTEFDGPVLRNNLAMAVFQQEEPQRTLDILAPCLDPEREDMAPTPYSWALASRALAQLGREEEANGHLRYAEAFFQDALNAFRAEKIDEAALQHWKEYAVSIIKAAAELEDHDLVLELYQRWKTEFANWESTYLAGVASFNLQRYSKAASLWADLGREWSMGYQFQRVAVLVGQEVIPPFTLNYKLRTLDELQQLIEQIIRDEAYLTEALQDTCMLLFLLSMTQDPEVEMAFRQDMVTRLVLRGDKWGEELGLRLLKSPAASTPLKVAAAQGLVEKGVFQPGEPVPMVVDGEERAVEIKTLQVTDTPDRETKKDMEEARKLREKGDLEGAIEVLKAACHRDTFFPPAAINLSNLLRQVDRLDEAETYLRMVEEVFPDDPAVLLNLSGLLYQQEAFAEARAYLDRLEEIPAADLDEELLEKMNLLRGYLTEADRLGGYDEQFEALMARIEEFQRKKIEKKPLSTEPNLARCLKNMPAEWLTGICVSLQLDPASRRGEREEQIRGALVKEANLRMLLEEFTGKREQQLLSYLLQKGGWARLSAVSRKFGSMEGDGFYWEAEIPASSLGVLWSLGLVGVGKAHLENRREKIAVIPLELRQPLSAILGIEMESVE